LHGGGVIYDHEKPPVADCAYGTVGALPKIHMSKPAAGVIEITALNNVESLAGEKNDSLLAYPLFPHELSKHLRLMRQQPVNVQSRETKQGTSAKNCWFSPR